MGKPTHRHNSHSRKSHRADKMFPMGRWFRVFDAYEGWTRRKMSKVEKQVGKRMHNRKVRYQRIDMSEVR